MENEKNDSAHIGRVGRPQIHSVVHQTLGSVELAFANSVIEGSLTLIILSVDRTTANLQKNADLRRKEMRTETWSQVK